MTENQKYIIALRNTLDNAPADGKERIIKEAIDYLKSRGVSDNDIIKLFDFEYILEHQDNSEMLKNHRRYKEIAIAVVKKKKG